MKIRKNRSVSQTRIAVSVAFFACLAISVSSPAQGLFAKASAQNDRVLAVFESIWDDYYGGMGTLLVAEVDKEDGSLEFDASKGMAHFPIRLKIDEAAYGKWLSSSYRLLDAVGVRKRGSGDRSDACRQIGPEQFVFGSNADAEIDRACAEGEIEIPRAGVVVELVDESGAMIQYAGLPLGAFECKSGKGANKSGLPLFGLRRGRDLGFDTKDSDEIAWCSCSFSGITKESLTEVSDIRCRVLVDPEFTSECRRLAREKIARDDALFRGKGIETKTVLLPGGVPMALNRIPGGVWFCRYEVTQDQWTAIMGDDPSVSSRTRYEAKDVATVDRYLEKHGESQARRVDAPDLPVDYIGWFDAVTFVSKLNNLPEVKSAGLVFRIPQGLYVYHRDRWESDSNHGIPLWDAACLFSPQGPKNPGPKDVFGIGIDYGFDLDGAPLLLEETAWCKAKPVKEKMSRGRWDDCLHPVGMKRPNAMGLYDMIGNAGEMVDTKIHEYKSYMTVKSPDEDSKENYGFKSCDDISMDGKPYSGGKGLRLVAEGR